MPARASGPPPTRSPKRPTGQQPNRGPGAGKQSASHARAAKARLEAQRRQRNRLLLAGGATVLVVVIIAVLLAAKAGSGGTHAAAPPGAAESPAPASAVAALAGIPAAQLAREVTAVGSGVGSPSAAKEAALTAGGRPEVLYIGAEFCPYCAAERWAVVTALSQFGTFNGLLQTHSSSVDTDPNTPTFSFHGTTYSSPYLSFTGVETTTNQPQGSFYAKLDTPTPAQAALFQADTGGYIPFVDLGGRFIIKNPQYDPKLLAGMTVEQVATAAADPSTAVGKAIEASAGKLVAALCQVTGSQPASVCSAFTGTGAGS